MKYVTTVAILLSGAVLFCACSTDEGPASPEATASLDTFYGVSGLCVNGGGGVNGVECTVCYAATGFPVYNFWVCGGSRTHPLLGDGYYECALHMDITPPPDGTWLVVKGEVGSEPWGSSDPFQWYYPSVTGVTVTEY